jgi:NADH-quinone oxidoreductase subunit J
MRPDDFPLFYVFHFYLFGLIAIVSGIVFVTRKSPVAAAMWLVVTMACLAVEYIMLDAQFIGVMQVLVYTGAIMVVFLFVIMLLNLGRPSDIADARGMGMKLLAGFVGLVFLGEIAVLTKVGIPAGKYMVPATFANDQLIKHGAVGMVAKPLYQDYALAFELASIVILVAIIGAVALGRRRTADAR